MKKICMTCVLISILLPGIAYGQTQLLLPEGQSILAQDVAWNKWTTKNFVILSYDQQQGKYVSENIEKMKEWLMDRWGMPNINFRQECRIFCVPDREKMKTFFGIERSHGEMRNGLSILWLVLDESPAATIPPSLTYICLSELGAQYKFPVGFWAIRGTMHLNGTLSQIRGQLRHLQVAYKNDSQLFFGDSLFSIDAATWDKQPKAIQDLFDAQAMVVCLLLRKEYGQTKFTRFLRGGGTEAALRAHFGFKDFDAFDRVFNRYMKHILTDGEEDSIPDEYIQITKA